MGRSDWWYTTTKHNKAGTMCIHVMPGALLLTEINLDHDIIFEGCIYSPVPNYVKVWSWMNYYIPIFYTDVIIYPCPNGTDWTNCLFIKGALIKKFWMSLLEAEPCLRCRMGDALKAWRMVFILGDNNLFSIYWENTSRCNLHTMSTRGHE